MIKTKLFLLCLLVSALLNAEDCPDPCPCDEGPQTARMSVRHSEPGGIGYPNGYTTFELFYAPHLRNYSLYGFIDLRAHLMNDDKAATNVGIGFRPFPSHQNLVYGVNLYWDWRKTRHASFHQLGPGLEFLWPCWDLTFNSYFPVGRTRKTYAVNKDQVAMKGVDGTLGHWFVKYPAFNFHAAIGGYYLSGDLNQRAAGGFFRGEINIIKWINLRGQASYDTLFRWQGYGEIGFSLVFGSKVCRSSCLTRSCCDLIRLEERLVEQPDRFEIMPIPSVTE